MNNLTLAVVVGTIAVALVSGTVSLEFHPDKLATLGNWAVGQFSSFAATESIRDQFIAWQRQAEGYLFKDKTHTIDIALKNAQADAKHLSELSDKTSDSKTLEPATKLLMGSLTSLSAATKDVSVDRSIELKPEISKVFADSSITLEVIKSKGVVIDNIVSQLASITDTIQKYIGKLGQVAGVEDVATPTPKPTPTNTPKATIPIRF